MSVDQRNWLMHLLYTRQEFGDCLLVIEEQVPPLSLCSLSLSLCVCVCVYFCSFRAHSCGAQLEATKGVCEYALYTKGVCLCTLFSSFLSALAFDPPLLCFPCVKC